MTEMRNRVRPAVRHSAAAHEEPSEFDGFGRKVGPRRENSGGGGELVCEERDFERRRDERLSELDVLAEHSPVPSPRPRARSPAASARPVMVSPSSVAPRSSRTPARRSRASSWSETLCDRIVRAYPTIPRSDDKKDAMIRAIALS